MVLRFVGGIGLFFSFTEVSKEEVRKLTAFSPFLRLKSFVKLFQGVYYRNSQYYLRSQIITQVKFFQAISLLKSTKRRACLYSTLGVLAALCYLDYRLQLDTTLKCGDVKFKFCRKVAIQVYHSPKVIKRVLVLYFVPLFFPPLPTCARTHSLGGFLVWGIFFMMSELYFKYQVKKVFDSQLQYPDDTYTCFVDQ